MARHRYKRLTPVAPKLPGLTCDRDPRVDLHIGETILPAEYRNSGRTTSAYHTLSLKYVFLYTYRDYEAKDYTVEAWKFSGNQHLPTIRLVGSGADKKGRHYRIYQSPLYRTGLSLLDMGRPNSRVVRGVRRAYVRTIVSFKGTAIDSYEKAALFNSRMLRYMAGDVPKELLAAFQAVSDVVDKYQTPHIFDDLHTDNIGFDQNTGTLKLIDPIYNVHELTKQIQEYREKIKLRRSKKWR